MTKKLSQKTLKSLNEALSQVLVEHGLAGLSPIKLYLTPDGTSDANFCKGPDEHIELDTKTGNRICVKNKPNH